MLKEQGRDVHGQFLQLLPQPPANPDPQQALEERSNGRLHLDPAGST
jgi:hypothetical protein